MAIEGERTHADYDSREEARQHVMLVALYIDMICADLVRRATVHDASKWRPEEYLFRDKHLPELRASEYGSAEYDAILKKMKPAIDHHHQLNSHHPEHFRNGVAGMNIIDLVEMFADWCAVMHKKGEKINTHRGAQRYKFDPQLVNIFQNTEEMAEIIRAKNGAYEP